MALRVKAGGRKKRKSEPSYNCLLRRLTHLNLQAALELRHSFQTAYLRVKREKKKNTEEIFCSLVFNLL